MSILNRDWVTQRTLTCRGCIRILRYLPSKKAHPLNLVICWSTLLAQPTIKQRGVGCLSQITNMVAFKECRVYSTRDLRAPTSSARSVREPSKNRWRSDVLAPRVRRVDRQAKACRTTSTLQTCCQASKATRKSENRKAAKRAAAGSSPRRQQSGYPQCSKRAE